VISRPIRLKTSTKRIAFGPPAAEPAQPPSTINTTSKARAGSGQRL
jgi:hypothetical protein